MSCFDRAFDKCVAPKRCVAVETLEWLTRSSIALGIGRRSHILRELVSFLLFLMKLFRRVVLENVILPLLFHI